MADIIIFDKVPKVYHFACRLFKKKKPLPGDLVMFLKYMDQEQFFFLA